jgi:hypothetical protein
MLFETTVTFVESQLTRYAFNDKTMIKARSSARYRLHLLGRDKRSGIRKFNSMARAGTHADWFIENVIRASSVFPRAPVSE